MSRNRKDAFAPINLQYLGIANELYTRSSHVESVELIFYFYFRKTYNLKANFLGDISIA